MNVRRTILAVTAAMVLGGCTEKQLEVMPWPDPQKVAPYDTTTRVLNEMKQFKPGEVQTIIVRDDARITELEQEMARLRAAQTEALAKLRAELDECRAALTRCEADRDRLTSELNAKDAEINRLKAELAALGASLAALQAQPPTIVEKVVEKVVEVPTVIEKVVTVPLIELRADALFDTAKADLRPNAEKALHNAAEALKKFGPNIKSVKVDGHADSRRIHTKEFPSNKELSEARARAVADYLIAHSGLPADKFIVTGYGDSQPVADNKTKEGQAENRRVVVTVEQGP
jgi:flagellar motor protein MotB